jgi:hypothetical protein
MQLRVRRTAAVIAALGLFTSQACYTYRPVDAAATPRVGERVRVVLTSEGTTELARYLGPGVTVAEGQLSQLREDGALVVAVDFVQQSNGVKQPWSGEGLVTFPTAYRTEVHERTYLRRQSVAATVALSTLVVAIAIVALKAGGAFGSEGGGGTPPPP